MLQEYVDELESLAHRVATDPRLFKCFHQAYRPYSNGKAPKSRRCRFDKNNKDDNKAEGKVDDVSEQFEMPADASQCSVCAQHLQDDTQDASTAFRPQFYCLLCPGVVLCATCEAADKHDPAHPLVKWKTRPEEVASAPRPERPEPHHPFAGPPHPFGGFPGFFFGRGMRGGRGGHNKHGGRHGRPHGHHGGRPGGRNNGGFGFGFGGW
jgi:hypothetical protein